MNTSTTPGNRGRVVFLASSVCSTLTTIVAVVFLVVGIGDGSVSSFNLVLWLGLLSVIAFPGSLAVFFLLLVIVTQPRWNECRECARGLCEGPHDELLAWAHQT